MVVDVLCGQVIRIPALMRDSLIIVELNRFAVALKAAPCAAFFYGL